MCKISSKHTHTHSKIQKALHEGETFASPSEILGWPGVGGFDSFTNARAFSYICYLNLYFKVQMGKKKLTYRPFEAKSNSFLYMSRYISFRKGHYENAV